MALKRATQYITPDGEVHSLTDYILSLIPVGHSESSPGITMNELDKQVDVSRPTIHYTLQHMMSAGEIKREKIGYSWYYYKTIARGPKERFAMINLRGAYHPSPAIIEFNKGKKKNPALAVAVALPLLGAHCEASLGKKRAYADSLSAAREIMRAEITRLQSRIEAAKSFIDDEYTSGMAAYTNGSFEAWSAIALEDFDMVEITEWLMEVVNEIDSPVDLSFLFSPRST